MSSVMHKWVLINVHIVLLKFYKMMFTLLLNFVQKEQLEMRFRSHVDSLRLVDCFLYCNNLYMYLVFSQLQCSSSNF